MINTWTNQHTIGTLSSFGNTFEKLETVKCSNCGSNLQYHEISEHFGFDEQFCEDCIEETLRDKDEMNDTYRSLERCL